MIWTKEQKEALRRTVSDVTRKQVRTHELAELSGVDAKNIRQFLSSGHLGDEKCNLLIRALEAGELLPGPTTLDRMEPVESEMVQKVLYDLEMLRVIIQKEGVPLTMRLLPALTVANRIREALVAEAGASQLAIEHSVDSSL